MKAQFKTTLITFASVLFSVALIQNSAATTTTVNVGPGFTDTFDPPTVSISVNDSVIWDWQGTFHSSTSGSPPGTADGLWDSGLATSTPHFFTNTFTTAGTFPYFCEYPSAVSVLNFSHPSDTHFQFAYTADIGLNYVVQRSADMMIWIPLATNQAANNPVLFDDPNATNGLDYYRVGRMPNP